jgi:4-alpha-glucanotransferase
VIFPRASGILLHLTSLPGQFGIGDLGAEARKFVDFLVASGQSLWQILPLGPTGYGDSPYQSLSAFAGNTLLISPAQLLADGLLAAEDIPPIGFPQARVDFGRVIAFKRMILERAFARFREKPFGFREEFERFCEWAASWLDDYALFRALKEAHGEAPWNLWDKAFARRQELAQARAQLRERIEAHKFHQFLFFKQWLALKSYCNERGVKIIGDVPLFVAYDSADVWANPHLFKLDENGAPKVVAGVPPDYFSATGQLWGNPIYDWDRLKSEGFHWWIERVRWTLQLVDIVRLDHFRGFVACWEVPGEDKTAERGRWVEAPGNELLSALTEELGQLPFIAEDLGFITTDVIALRDHFGFPGMRILQYAFGGDSRDQNLPHNYPRNAVVYTGTHDNDTVIGWFNGRVGVDSTRGAEQIERERRFCMKYLNTDGREINWDFIRAAFASVADLAIVPLQDVLGLGSEARMNLPASAEGNWSWRYTPDSLTEEHSRRLRELSELYGRSVGTV